MKIGDAVILGLVAVWLFLVILFWIRKKKRGECIGCSGGTCMNCPKKTGIVEK